MDLDSGCTTRIGGRDLATTKKAVLESLHGLDAQNRSLTIAGSKLDYKTGSCDTKTREFATYAVLMRCFFMFLEGTLNLGHSTGDRKVAGYPDTAFK